MIAVMIVFACHEIGSGATETGIRGSGVTGTTSTTTTTTTGGIRRRQETQDVIQSRQSKPHRLDMSQDRILFPSSGKQSPPKGEENVSRKKEHRHHASPVAVPPVSSDAADAASTGMKGGSVERKTARIDAHSSLTSIHATDFNELKGRYGYFPPSMFRDFMQDARDRTYNTLYGSIDAKGMFRPANHLPSYKQSLGSPIGQGIPFNTVGGSSEGTVLSLSDGKPIPDYDTAKSQGIMTDVTSYTPSYHTSGSGESERQQRKNRQVQIGETLSSLSSSQSEQPGTGRSNQRSLGLLSHMLHPSAMIAPPVIMASPYHHFTPEMMPLMMPPFHSPFHSMLPLHQLDHLYPYGRPFMPFMNPLMAHEAAFGFGGMMPPAYPGLYGMGMYGPGMGMYHRSNTDAGRESGSSFHHPAPSNSHASQIHLTGGVYPPVRQPFTSPFPHSGHHSPDHSPANHQHHYPHDPLHQQQQQHRQHSSPLFPSRIPGSQFPYSFLPTPYPYSSESKPDLSSAPSSASSHKHHDDGPSGWQGVDESRSTPHLPSRPQTMSGSAQTAEHNPSTGQSLVFPFIRQRSDVRKTA